MNAVIDDVMPAWEYSVHASQATFRCVLNALAEPGTVHVMPVEVAGPAPLGHALTALSLTLFDFETPVWLDAEARNAAISSYLRFHCGCPLVDAPADAAFALSVEAANIDISRFAQGSMEYPDRSTTLLIQVPSFESGPQRTISGPGIPATRSLRVAGLPPDFDVQWRANTAAFPLGVDIVFCCGSKIIGLPRTAQVQCE
jgi:alpha-D-ribose 1-methylphosphonate 5-triphosphate synthase subunit PhnH